MKIKIYSEINRQYGYWVDNKFDPELHKTLAVIIYSDGTAHETSLRNITVIDPEYLATENN